MADATLRIAAVGDVMFGDSSHFLDRGVGTHVERHGPAYPLAEVRALIEASDVFFANLESPLARPNSDHAFDRVYLGPEGAEAALMLAPVNVVSIANNHILEHGASALAETRRRLAAAGILHAGFAQDGSSASMVTRWEHRDLSCMLVADSLVPDHANRMVDAAASLDRICRRVGEDSADVKIVSLHWGDEYVPVPAPRQRVFARRLVEAGAALVLGHHPHVLQPVEEIGSGLVAYSLGNFLFDQDWTVETTTGGVLEVEVGRDGVVAWRFVPTRTGSGCRTRPAEGEMAARALDAVAASPAIAPREYDRLLRRNARRHRAAMKWELVRHWWRVRPATLAFLLAKRVRARGPGGPP